MKSLKLLALLVLFALCTCESCNGERYDELTHHTAVLDSLKVISLLRGDTVSLQRINAELALTEKRMQNLIHENQQ